MPFPYLQSYVTKVVSYEERPDFASVRQVHGTAALIGPSGEFITAAHVLKEAVAACRGTGRKVAAAPMVKHRDGNVSSVVVEILRSEDAPAPYDIAVFKTAFVGATPLRIADVDVDVWQDCATLGYPAQATMPAGDIVEVQSRALKGYIQRKVPAGRAERPGHPDSFELSFVVTRGMSGSPLFLYQGQSDALIGICVGSIRSEIVATDIEPFEPGQRVVRLEEYGWAHDVRGLREWAPTIFGKSLGSLNA